MTDDDILKVSKERFQTIQTAEAENRTASLESLKFAYNVEEGQWDANDRKEREQEERPCLSANKLRKFISQVANRERENRIAMNVVPVDDKSDIPRAKILGGLIRNIEYQSSADEIYAQAGEQAIGGGVGYWRILTDYADDSFDQEIRMEIIDNPFSVYFDPKEKFCFVREAMTKKEFKVQYPDAIPHDFDLSSLGEEYSLWYEKEKVFIAEYFQKEPIVKEIAQIRDGITGELAVYELSETVTIDVLMSQGIEVLKTRKVKTDKIVWYKLTGHEVLEKQDWAGKYIPIVPVLGDRVNVAGKIYKRSLIVDAMDPQKMYNYWLTSMTEKVALVPKAPYIVTPQEIQGHEAMWDEANRKNLPYLLARTNREIRRQQPIQVDTGAMAMLNIANNDIKDIIGMYEPALGAQSNERSGRAIFAKQKQSDLGTFLFPDNLRRALIKSGRILIDLIPRIYDTERIERIRSYEGKEEFVDINKTIINEETGETVIVNDLSQGKYDVQADIRLYSTRRQETVDLIRDAMQYAPQIAPLLVPLLFKYVDAPGAEEILEEIKQATPALMGEGAV